jgi:hypothetical protein
MGKGFGEGGKSGGKGKAGEPKKPVTRSHRAGLQVTCPGFSNIFCFSTAMLAPVAMAGLVVVAVNLQPHDARAR